MNHPFLKFKHKKINLTAYKPKRLKTKIRGLLDEKVLSIYQLELLGILNMIDGLEYHYHNIVKIEKKCKKYYKKMFEEEIIISIPAKNMIHEIVAYLNQLGRISTALRSDWFKEYVTERDLVTLCPSILALFPLRNKFAAHRSIDAPSGESDNQKVNHASLPFGLKWIRLNIDSHIHDMNISYHIKIYKSDRKILDRHKIPLVPTIENLSGDEIWVTFIPIKQHNKISDEIIKVFEKFVSKQK